ncbi:hypothetical protein Vi05172_g13623 [Venturia inaequalis]|nr:hypothetical protein Vi05172_g13623 [Venturia inaequalis]
MWHKISIMTGYMIPDLDAKRSNWPLTDPDVPQVAPQAVLDTSLHYIRHTLSDI